MKVERFIKEYAHYILNNYKNSRFSLSAVVTINKIIILRSNGFITTDDAMKLLTINLHDRILIEYENMIKNETPTF